MTITSLDTTATNDGQVLTLGPLTSDNRPLYRIRHIVGSGGREAVREGHRWRLSHTLGGDEIGTFYTLEAAQYRALSYAIEIEAEKEWRATQQDTRDEEREEAKATILLNSKFAMADLTDKAKFGR